MPSNTPPPNLPPSDELPPFTIGTIQNFHLSYGTNAQTTSTSTVDQSVNQSFFTRMAAHGWGYWVFHFILALLAAATFELMVWQFHWMGH
jgi:hypothetical protein